MIKFIHLLCKVGIGLWTIGCGFFTVMMFIGMSAKVGHQAITPEASVGIVGGSIIGFAFLACLWFFPTITMVLVAYFTRPQAWIPVSEPKNSTELAA